MSELIKAGLAMGWPAIALLAGLLVYFKFSISDPAANKRAMFKTFIGIIGRLSPVYGYCQLQDRISLANPASCRSPSF